jgi:aminoglycoside 2'-N-acetyltransferase I
MIRIAHTAELGGADREAIRELMDAAFGSDFGEDDFEHALGGVHVLVTLDDRLVSHGSVVQRRLVAGRRALRTGYVEAVATHPDHQEQGHGSTVMTEIERIIDAAYDLGALAASDTAREWYRSRGWLVWTGMLSVLTADGRVPTPGERGGVLVRPVVPLPLEGELTADPRPGDVW